MTTRKAKRAKLRKWYKRKCTEELCKKPTKIQIRVLKKALKMAEKSILNRIIPPRK